MIPSGKAKEIQEKKIETKEIEETDGVVCCECNKVLTEKPKKNSLKDTSAYFVLKKEETEFHPYCSGCVVMIPFSKIDKMEKYSDYQKKLKAGML